MTALPPVGQDTISRRGAIGLAISAVSVALTAAVALLGPSLLEPALPGTAGQPPWAVAAHPSPYLVVALAGAAIITAVTGLTFSMNATHYGWSPPAKMILIAGITGALVLALLPPFGSSDHLSYAAYGRMAITGHDPYTTTPAMLARLGDPVARAVQDWRTSPSVYGPLAVAGQALAAWIGGTSVRLIVFVLSILNVLAFAGIGLISHWLGRGDKVRQARAALLWTGNPLLLMVLIAGAHVDSQAIVFGVAGLGLAMTGVRRLGRSGGPVWQPALIGAGAGLLIGLGFAIKVTTALIGAGIVFGILLLARHSARRSEDDGAHDGGARDGQVGEGGARDGGARDGKVGEGCAHDGGAHDGGGRDGNGREGGGRWRPAIAALAGLAAGFVLTVAATLIPWGTGIFGPAARAGSFTSIGSPWRPLRSAVRLLTGENAAEDLVKAGAILLAVLLLALLIRYIDTLRFAGALGRPDTLRFAGALGRPDTLSRAYVLSRADVLAASAFAVAFAWLLAWPYVLPWYDGLGWALLVLLPASRFDWLMLARTTALAVGYLPARGITLPPGLGWLESVVRTALTPAALLGILVIAVVWLWPWRREPFRGISSAVSS